MEVLKREVTPSRSVNFDFSAADPQKELPINVSDRSGYLCHRGLCWSALYRPSNRGCHRPAPVTAGNAVPRRLGRFGTRLPTRFPVRFGSSFRFRCLSVADRETTAPNRVTADRGTESRRRAGEPRPVALRFLGLRRNVTTTQARTGAVLAAAGAGPSRESR
jgi:hypothetical protein